MNWSMSRISESELVYHKLLTIVELRHEQCMELIGSGLFAMSPGVAAFLVSFECTQQWQHVVNGQCRVLCFYVMAMFIGSLSDVAVI